MEIPTKTNEVGLFVFPAVTPGPYRVTMEAPGFQKFEGALTVMVQTDVTVDGVLAVGQTTTQVEIQVHCTVVERKVRTLV
jgi:hypothetical protein